MLTIRWVQLFVVAFLFISNLARASDYNAANCQLVLNTLNIYWEAVRGPACNGIEFTNGTLQDAADGSISMSGVSVSSACLFPDSYLFDLSADKTTLSGIAYVAHVPMTLTRGPGEACFVGHWVAGSLDFVAHIAAAPFGASDTFVPVAGVWWNPSEPGSGFGLDYQNGTLIAEVYAYLPNGASQWYLAAGALTNNVFTATLDKYVNGQCVSCGYKAPGAAGNDGTITITFTSPTTATVDLPGGRHILIQRYFQSAPVAGAFIPIPGVWWNPNESGSGLGLDYDNGTLIAEVYSYLAGGTSQWYLAAGPVNNYVFTATLDKYTGGQCASCAYKAPAIAGNDGTITITFTSPTTATVDLAGGRHIQIERFFQP